MSVTLIIKTRESGRVTAEHWITGEIAYQFERQMSESSSDSLIQTDGQIARNLLGSHEEWIL